MCLPLTILHVHAYIQTYIYVEVDPAQCPRSSCLLNTIVGGCRYRSVKILYRCSATRKGRCNAVIVGMNRTLTRCIAHGHDATKPVPESVFGINVHDIRPLFRKPCLLYTPYSDLVIDSYSRGGWGDRVENRSNC